MFWWYAPILTRLPCCFPPRGAIFINRLQNKDRCGDALEHVQRERAAFDLSGVLSMLLTDNALTAIKLTAHQDD
jgi:hypothetical protein